MDGATNGTAATWDVLVDTAAVATATAERTRGTRSDSSATDSDNTDVVLGITVPSVGPMRAGGGV